MIIDVPEGKDPIGYVWGEMVPGIGGASESRTSRPVAPSSWKRAWSSSESASGSSAWTDVYVLMAVTLRGHGPTMASALWSKLRTLCATSWTSFAVTFRMASA